MRSRSEPGIAALLISVGTSSDGLDFFMSSLVPIGGPIAQMFFTGGEDWTIPILAVVDCVEVAGLIMAIVGTIGTEQEVRVEVGDASLELVPSGFRLTF